MVKHYASHNSMYTFVVFVGTTVMHLNIPITPFLCCSGGVVVGGGGDGGSGTGDVFPVLGCFGGVVGGSGGSCVFSFFGCLLTFFVISWFNGQ